MLRKKVRSINTLWSIDINSCRLVHFKTSIAASRRRRTLASSCVREWPVSARSDLAAPVDPGVLARSTMRRWNGYVCTSKYAKHGVN
ncbi:hypothetical protein NP493_10g02013 [Ridgeia piscesae]|uniref:Uncharacterized protein n=1 Tax=Ridgeia piscesae TaxID=27915 RepID=A0AAD9PF60_RIDPI|nr:hypothetical protein NP493_10g02013 [Ridgeia piscesae]